MTFNDQQHNRVVLDQRLGGGGEADIWSILGNPQSVAKIYKAPAAEYAGKLGAMLSKRPADPSLASGHRSICWPESLLFDALGKCQGFLMPRVDLSRSVPLFKLANPLDRFQTAPDFTWKYLLTAAANIARVAEAINALGYVIGDINESNFLVAVDARVVLVDCDSIQVPRPGKGYYRCRVAKPEFYAPELQGANPPDVDRTTVHDNFALAVLLFMLLMEGIHPFMGVWRGTGDPRVEDRIKRGLFPYGGHPLMAPSPIAPPLDLLPKSLQALFVRCFKDGHKNPTARPSATEWKNALLSAATHLAVCKINSRHAYSNHLSLCPWCVRKAAFGIDPYPPSAPKSFVQTSPIRPQTPVWIPGTLSKPGTLAGLGTGGSGVARTQPGLSLANLALPPGVAQGVSQALILLRDYAVVTTWTVLTLGLSINPATYNIAEISCGCFAAYLISRARRFTFWLLVPLLWAAYLLFGHSGRQVVNQTKASFNIYLGRLALARGDFSSARDACSAALRADFSNPRAQEFCQQAKSATDGLNGALSAAQSALENGDFQGAIQAALKAKTLQPSNAQAAQIVKDSNAAIAALDSIVKSGRNQLAAGDAAGAGRSCLDASKRSRVERASRDFCRAVSNVHVDAAKKAMATADWRAATAEADEAVKLDASYPDALSARTAARSGIDSAYNASLDSARSALARSDFAGAEESVRRANALNAFRPEAASLWGQIQIKKSEAQALDSHLSAARAAAALYNWEAVLTECRAAQQVDVSNRDANMLCHDAAKRIADFKQSIFSAGWYRQHGDYRNAIISAGQALAIRPADKSALALRASLQQEEQADLERRRLAARISSIGGSWSGKYACGAGFESLSLQLQESGNRLFGQCKFSVGRTMFQTPLEGVRQPNGTLEIHLSGVHGYAEGFRGTVNLTSGEIVGNVLGRDCGSFYLRRN